MHERVVSIILTLLKCKVFFKTLTIWSNLVLILLLYLSLQVFVQSPSSVKVYGPGVEPGVKTNKETYFVVDCKDAGPGKYFWISLFFGTTLYI